MKRLRWPTVQRIARITALLRRDYPAPQHYLAQHLGESTNVVHGTLVTMQARGLVQRDPNGWYRLCAPHEGTHG
jgi:DNA-binding IclR family transcriptional regulator